MNIHEGKGLAQKPTINSNTNISSQTRVVEVNTGNFTTYSLE